MKNRKLNIIVVVLMLLSITLSNFSVVKADTEAGGTSNDRRLTYIELAQGKSLAGLSNINDLDMNSLRVIALYLSNFYAPWSTEISEDLSSTENGKVLLDKMTQALSSCGIETETAEFLINSVMNSTMTSATPLYVEKSVLDAYATFTKGSTKGADGIYCLGFLESSIYSYKPKITTNTGDLTGALSICDGLDFAVLEGESSIGIKADDNRYDFYKALGEIKASDGDTEKEYVQVSYAVLLGLMSLSPELIVENTLDLFDRDYIMNADPAVYDEDKLEKIRSEARTLIESKVYAELPLATFYSLSKDSKMLPCYSNGKVDALQFIMCYDELNFEGGFGSAYSCVGLDDYKGLDYNQKFRAIAYGQSISVDWVGNLIVHTGTNNYIAVPACMNNTIFSPVDSTNVDKSTIYALSSYYLTKAQSSKITKSSEADTNYDFYENIAGKNLFTEGLNWRRTMGDPSVAFDVKSSGHGSFIDFAEDCTFMCDDADGFGDDDEAAMCTLHNLIPQATKSDTDDFIFATFPAISDILVADNFSTVTIDNIDKLSTYFKSASLLDCAISDFASCRPTSNFSAINKVGTINTALLASNMKKFNSSLFLTYAFAYFNMSLTAEEFNPDTHLINLKLNFDNLPTCDAVLDLSKFNAITSSTQDKTLSMIYCLLHPSEGIGYFATLMKNKLGGFFLSWHEDIVGGSSSNSATGMTSYLGTSSYTTIPNLNDVSWVSKLLSLYRLLLVYIIILVMIIMLCSIIVGRMTFQRGLIGVFIFLVCSILPPYVINLSVDKVNMASDVIFSEKFDFWAICQLQEYLLSSEAAEKSQEEGNDIEYVDFLLNQNAVSSGNTEGNVAGASKVGYSGVKLKWMSPKKYNQAASMQKAFNQHEGVVENKDTYLYNAVIAAYTTSTSGESFLDSDSALFLYRDYSDIYRYTSTGYNLIEFYNYNGGLLDVSDTVVLDLDSPLAIYRTVNYDSILSSWGSTLYLGRGMSLEKIDELPMYDLILANRNKEHNNVYSDMSSLKAMDRGFIFDTIPEENNFYWFDVTNTSRRTLATSYIMNYNATFREVYGGLQRLQKTTKEDSDFKVDLSDTAIDINTELGHFNFGTSFDTSMARGDFNWGYTNIKGLKSESLDEATSHINNDNAYTQHSIYRQLSSYFYGLYSESPFYFFDFNVRDQLLASEKSHDTFYYYNSDAPSASGLSVGEPTRNNLTKLFLANNQSYFFNLVEDSGDGYGELRDFTNMHDFFYFVVPYLKPGVDLARLYDDVYGLYTDKDISLRFNSAGEFIYDTKTYGSLEDFREVWRTLNAEQRYKFWHTYNTLTILNGYTSWLDTMMDCSYAKPEKIKVMGESYIVNNPLDPHSYCELDESNQIKRGRLMVFSESEMEYYGLDRDDLTSVEKKIIDFQKLVYERAKDLVNYYTLSDEVVIQAYSMIQLFAFNETFSQERVIGDSYLLYPTGYELKAFTYDAYMRMILSQATGEDLMSENNESIYQRVQKKTSLFMSLFLVFNDVLAVYVIPGFKLFFLILIFITSLLIILASALRLDFNIMRVCWKSLFAPLLSFSGISIAMSFIVSLFMADGASGVSSNTTTIEMGDPTTVIILMFVLNAIVVILYFKICKKCWKDFKSYAKMTFAETTGVLSGALGSIAGASIMGKVIRGRNKKDKRVNGDAKSRGEANKPKPQFKVRNRNDIDSDTAKGMNKREQRAYNWSAAREDKARNKYDKAQRKLNKSTEKINDAKSSGASARKIQRLEKKNSRLQSARNKKHDRLKNRVARTDAVAKKGVRGLRKYDTRNVKTTDKRNKPTIKFKKGAKSSNINSRRSSSNRNRVNRRTNKKSNRNRVSKSKRSRSRRKK